MATSSKKIYLEEELQRLDREIETTEREMTKLSFLAPQVFYIGLILLIDIDNNNF